MNEMLQREPVSRPGEPTSAPPGSAKKIRVLMERAARRESLFHPQDNLQRILLSTSQAVEAVEPVEAIEPDGPSFEAELAG